MIDWKTEYMKLAEHMSSPPIMHIAHNDVLANEILDYLRDIKRPTKREIMRIVKDNKK